MSFGEALDVAYGMQIDEMVRLGTSLEEAVETHAVWARGAPEPEPKQTAVPPDDLAARRRVAARNTANEAALSRLMAGTERR